MGQLGAILVTVAVNLGLLAALALLRVDVPAANPPPLPPPRVVAAPQPPPPAPPPQPVAVDAPAADAPAPLPALDLPSAVAAPVLGEPGDLTLGALGGAGLAGAVGGGQALALPAADKLVLDEHTVDEPPRPLLSPPPRYPPTARADGIQGRVVVALLVGADGQVEQVQVEQAEPPGVFDGAAVQAVRRWRFQPATYQGRAVRAWARQAVRFDLR
ncbi:MAG: energy transducer TonB [Myxococcales bacterium]|nr:energy transducer TonB [Myxococcales bacterium]MCB9525630.1 energy transducer TonB [Myxococcales bacterium]